MAATNKVKFKTNKPIMLPVQTKTWGCHDAVDMNYDEVFKLLAGGAEDIMLVADDGSETPITWDNLRDLFPEEEGDSAASIPTTLESDIFAGYDESYDPYIHGFDEGVQAGDVGISQPIEIAPEGGTSDVPFTPITEPVEIPAGPTINIPADQFVDKESGIAFPPNILPPAFSEEVQTEESEVDDTDTEKNIETEAESDDTTEDTTDVSSEESTDSYYGTTTTDEVL